MRTGVFFLTDGDRSPSVEPVDSKQGRELEGKREGEHKDRWLCSWDKASQAADT